MSLLTALQSFTTQPLLHASRTLFKDALGIPLSPLADAAIEPKRFFRDQHKEDKHSGIKHLYLVGRIDDRCFQHAQLALDGALDLDATLAAIAKDYDGMFVIAVDMTDADFTRSDLASRTREINRVFTNPVIVLFKHLHQKQPVLSIGVISRRDHKRTQGAHVLGKVSMIREIRPQSPHSGHIEILKDFSFTELEKNAGKVKRGHKIDSFKSFHAALEAVFDTDLLNKRFYKDLANWYFWALPQVEFPADLEKDDEKRRATGLIRLLTRLIFCWFLKEKDGLIPEKLFQPAELSKLLKGFDPESETSSTYYHAILQNLFFATLNQRMGKDGKGNPYRVFAKDEGFHKNRATYDVNNLYRYENLFTVSEDEALALFADIPFLNGGLFECLDRTEDETNKKLYLDGFSRRKEKRPHVPDRLFFDSGETADLAAAYGDNRRNAEPVAGLISILNRYKFTIVENTPIDQEIALDPELLGKVFENLLASYNEETKTTARKQTGSFYTPRPIVDYMVDESLKAHFSRCLIEKAGMQEDDAKAGLDLLFTYTEKEHPFSPKEVSTLITAIDEVKILDPACGSGAFPMGVLHKLVYILGKLDPDNERWKQTQLAKLDSAPMREALETAFEDNNDDYGRKLYLIENCLYGVDIQPIAIQITKLRFFISLVCDQKTNRDKSKNHGIRPLPNLETKFVAADTLIGLPIPEPELFIRSLIEPIEKEIEECYHRHFAIQNRKQKRELQDKIKSLRLKLADTIVNGLGAGKNADVIKKAKHIAEWDPFDPQSTGDFFDPHWMFGHSLKDGFDVIIGNPPYVLLQGGNRDNAQSEYFRKNFKVASYKLDLYHLFIERGVKLLKKPGTICYITPSNFTSNNYSVALRRFLLTETELEKLVFFDDGVFDASVHNLVFLAHKNSASSASTSFIKAAIDSFTMSFDIKSRVEQAGLVDEMCLLVPSSGTGADSIVRKLAQAAETFGSVASVNFGMQLRDRSEYPQDVVESPSNKSFLTSFHRECYAGKDVHRFFVSFTNRYCFFNRIAKRGGCWDEGIHTAKNKILVRQIGEYPEGGLDTRGYAVLNAAFMIFPKTDAVEPGFLLGVLNSKVIRFFWKNKFRDDRKTFPKIKGEYLKLLPLPKASTGRQASIVKIVEEIVAAKQSNPAADTNLLEREIDQLVYALYGLTPEEIAIVEEAAS